MRGRPRHSEDETPGGNDEQRTEATAVNIVDELPRTSLVVFDDLRLFLKKRGSVNATSPSQALWQLWTSRICLSPANLCNKTLETIAYPEDERGFGARCSDQMDASSPS
ncbi:hypothetical protein AU210_003829 [Fusarium oxysporum f. sp. radicis-cucumerinum]|uniref:Uncharacterized protein n=1 Tax=Fusarium oxysporum f. sp. radicis-cucumerinum TaxID=327505 RepID=A0A2H3HV29_FUSOX|nr:hypothetical protein AU210_003829 [Fusarium oxysporum f. sp. radicis-cucumerinum]